MRSYEERAKDFIKQVFPYISSCQKPWEISRRIEMFNEDFDRKVVVSSGLSRIALITSDYVVKFDYNPDEVACIGGCDNEVALYNLAEREGFAYLFAKITMFVYRGRYFYIMPRIRGIGSSWHYAEYHMTIEERAFCRRHRITDLHEENYGFRKGHVCVIDYACHDSCDSDYDCYFANRIS